MSVLDSAARVSPLLSVRSEHTGNTHGALLSPGADTLFVLCVTAVAEASSSCPGEQLGSQILQEASAEAVAEDSSSGIPSGRGESQPWVEAGMCHVLQGRILVAQGAGSSSKASSQPRSVCSHLLTPGEAGESGKAGFQRDESLSKDRGKNLLEQRQGCAVAQVTTALPALLCLSRVIAAPSPVHLLWTDVCSQKDSGGCCSTDLVCMV